MCNVRRFTKVCTPEHMTQLRKCPPPFFDDPMVRVYMRYTYKWLLRVNAHPRFLAREFQAPMGGDYGTATAHHRVQRTRWSGEHIKHTGAGRGCAAIPRSTRILCVSSMGSHGPCSAGCANKRRDHRRRHVQANCEQHSNTLKGSPRKPHRRETWTGALQHPTDYASSSPRTRLRPSDQPVSSYSVATADLHRCIWTVPSTTWEEHTDPLWAG